MIILTTIWHRFIVTFVTGLLACGSNNFLASAAASSHWQHEDGFGPGSMKKYLYFPKSDPVELNPAYNSFSLPHLSTEKTLALHAKELAR